MGFLSKLFGGGAKMPEATANEKALGKVSLAQADRYRDVYQPMQKQLAGLASKDRSATLRGRTNASFMQQLSDEVKGPLNTTGAIAIGDAGSAGLGAGLKSATDSDMARRDKINSAVVKLGMGDASSAIDGLSSASKASATMAESQFKQQMERTNQKFQLAGTGLAIGYGYKDEIGNLIESLGYTGNRRPGATPGLLSR